MKKMNSLWLDSGLKRPSFPALSKDVEADVCIIGAGIFGITCAYYLSNLGFNVVVLEKDYIGSKTTGHTTAKITSQHDLFYNYLVSSYGNGFAKDYLEANEQAIQNIKDIIDKENIKCDFEYQNNYVYATKKTDLLAIKKEISSLESIGFPCELVTKTGLPFDVAGAVCFKNQAQFHPLKYLYGLAKSISSCNVKIYTNTTATNLEQNLDSSYTVFANDSKVKCNFVVVASHYPFINFPGFYFLKMYQSTSYLIAVDTKKTLFNGMYISYSDPIFSYRTAKFQGKNLLLIGGGEHKTGQPSCFEDTYGILENEAKKFYPDAKVLFRWNTRDCISLDKLPYVGIYSNYMPRVYVGTGFKKWGMTLSNVASSIVVDAICNKENRYAYLFNPSRLKPIKNRDEMKNMLVQSTNSLLLDKFRPANMPFDEVQNNSGSIIDVNGQKVGIYKNSDGKIYAVKPFCTHLGCQLSWNDVDKTWDCPCHGSRFDYKGKNLYDPAFKDLESYEL